MNVKGQGRQHLLFSFSIDIDNRTDSYLLKQKQEDLLFSFFDYYDNKVYAGGVVQAVII